MNTFKAQQQTSRRQGSKDRHMSHQRWTCLRTGHDGDADIRALIFNSMCAVSSSCVLTVPTAIVNAQGTLQNVSQGLETFCGP